MSKRTVYVLHVDDAALDARDSTSAYEATPDGLLSAKIAAQAYHTDRRVDQQVEPFQLSWRMDEDRGHHVADDVALSIDFTIALLEVGA